MNNLKTDMTTYHEHIPVLAQTSIELMITDKDGIYVDATLGGAGHSLLILDQLGEEGALFGIDQDMEAIQAAEERVGRDDRFTTVRGNFGYLQTILPPAIHQNIDGFLFDLGVSTHQIKEPERGFSIQHDGPLDMRMSDLTGISAYQVVNEYSYEKLRDIIFHYGEERLSREIARAIVEQRPVESTGELRKIIENVVYGRHTLKSVTRVFQAVRIEVNRELDMLKQALEQAFQLLKPGGRIAAISYHSLEDRLVKNFFKSGNFDGKIEKDFYGNPLVPMKLVNRQIITPSDEEIDENRAARSAKLRIAEKRPNKES